MLTSNELCIVFAVYAVILAVAIIGAVFYLRGDE